MIHGIGVDVVEIPRIRALVARRGDAFLRRLYTQEERDYVAAHQDPAPSLAARFAAKEAAIKALGVGWAPGMTWRDFEVVRKDGPPLLVLHGAAAEVANLAGIGAIHLSLSHERETALAFVVLERV